MPDAGLPPDAAAISRLAEVALSGIPAGLRAHMRNVAVAVEELADDATLDALGIESAWDLTGVYQGVPLTQRTSGQALPPDMIVLYRQAILLEWIETEVDLATLVANVMVHEAGHHFGFSDEEIAALEGELP